MTVISCSPMMRGQLDPKPRETSTWESWLDKDNKSDLSSHLNDYRSVTNPRLIFQRPVPVTRNARLFKRQTSPVITEEKDLERKVLKSQERRLLFP